jgi:hypothetical protein
MCVPGMLVPQLFSVFLVLLLTNSIANNQLRVAFEAIFFRGQTIQEIIINDLRYIFVENLRCINILWKILFKDKISGTV